MGQGFNAQLFIYVDIVCVVLICESTTRRHAQSGILRTLSFFYLCPCVFFHFLRRFFCFPQDVVMCFHFARYNN